MIGVLSCRQDLNSRIDNWVLTLKQNKILTQTFIYVIWFHEQDTRLMAGLWQEYKYIYDSEYDTLASRSFPSFCPSSFDSAPHFYSFSSSLSACFILPLFSAAHITVGCALRQLLDFGCLYLLRLPLYSFHTWITKLAHWQQWDHPKISHLVWGKGS